MPDQPSDSPEPSPSPDALRQDDTSREPTRGGPNSGHATSGGPTSGGPPKPADSVELLNQILGRLQRMEGGLTLHEQWLRRIEEEQRQAETAAPPAGAPDAEQLQRLVGSLTLERDRARSSLAEAQRQLGQYQQELTDLRARTTELSGRLADRDQEFGRLKNTATKGVEQVRTLQSEAQRQLQLRQQQLQAVQAQLSSSKRELQERDQRIIELQDALDEAARRFESIPSDTDAALADRAWTRFSRFAVVMTFVAALASVGLTGWLFDRSHGAALQTVSGTLMLPGMDAAALKACADRASKTAGVQVATDEKLGTIELSVQVRDGQAGAARIDELARTILSGVTPANVASIGQPASRPEGQAIATKIADTDRQLAAARATAVEPQADPARLLAEYEALRQERAGIVEKLGKLGREIGASGSQPAQADVGAEEIAEAEAKNAALQSEIEAFRQREEQLAGRLRVTVDSAALRFETLLQALTEADGHLQKSLGENHPAEVNKQLTTVRDSLKTWARALADVGAAWKRQRAILNSPGADALGVQAELEKSARAFVGEITPANTEFAKAIEAIGQGQDQTTKRLVLRNSLVKELASVTTGQQETGNAVRAVILTDNIELTGIVQRLDALRLQIQQRRIQIAGGIRQERVSLAQKNRNSLLARLRHEQEGLTKRVAEIDAALLTFGEQATKLAREQADHSAQLASRAALLETKAADLGSLLAMHEQFAGEVAKLPPPPAPAWLPARVLANTSRGPTLVSALLLGATPVLGSAALLAMTWLVISSRRSRQTIEEYARTLKETARQASLPEDQAAASSERTAG